MEATQIESFNNNLDGFMNKLLPEATFLEAKKNNKMITAAAAWLN